MSRISKTDVNAALQAAAQTIIGAGGEDKRISRADVKKALALVPVTKPVFAKYSEMLAEDYPHLVE